MKHLALGQSNLTASRVGLGAWVMGGGSVWGPNPDDRESIRAIHAALDAGVNLIDTAPVYGFGRSEEVVGKAIKGRRRQVVLATKCGLWWDDERGSFFKEFDGRPLRRCLRPETIRLEVDRSLARLGTDHIDLYQTHVPAAAPDLTPIADTMACLLELKTQGKIRAIGVSNVSLAELQENCACGQVASNQFRYSILFREPEEDILPYCAQRRIATLTYMSLEQGLLTGKVGLDRAFASGEFRNDTAWNPWFIPANRKRILDLLGGWKDLTDKYACTLAQLVLAWTAAQPGVTHVLAGCRTPAQVQENLQAAALTIEAPDLERMRLEVMALGPPLPE
ncbi:MAG: aldo/keto reductase [Verrucomicrobia bacterium]|nr:aldo/keto reductase [Verrucomicrobiota bacterium]